MTWPRWLLVVYAAVNILMGVQAFFFPSSGHASLISLTAGAGAGFAILGAVWLSFKTEQGGFGMGVAVAGLLFLHFVNSTLGDFAMKKAIHFYPKPLSILLALAVAAALGIAHLQAHGSLRKDRSETDS